MSSKVQPLKDDTDSASRAVGEERLTDLKQDLYGVVLRGAEQDADPRLQKLCRAFKAKLAEHICDAAAAKAPN